MDIYTQNDYLRMNELPSYERDVNIKLLFPLDLLMQQNWHVNLGDDFGAITNNTFSASVLSQYIDKLPSMWGEYTAEAGFFIPELIFHDNIPIQLLQAIIVNDNNTKNQVDHILTKYNMTNVPVYIESRELGLQLSQLQYLYYPQLNIYLTNNIPQLCYTGALGKYPDEELTPNYVRNFYTSNNPYTMKYMGDLPSNLINQEDSYIWQKRLNNCGINEQYNPNKEQEYLNQIEDKMQGIYFNDGQRVIINEYPPWKYTPEYYQSLDKTTQL